MNRLSILAIILTCVLAIGCDAIYEDSRLRHSQETEFTFGQWVTVERGFCRGRIGKTTDFCSGLYQVRLYRHSVRGYEPDIDLDGSVWITWAKPQNLKAIDSPDPFE